MFFRILTAEEEIQFRAWTRRNYQPGAEIDGAWHPVVRDEARRLNTEHEYASTAVADEAVER